MPFGFGVSACADHTVTVAAVEASAAATVSAATAAAAVFARRLCKDQTNSPAHQRAYGNENHDHAVLSSTLLEDSKEDGTNA